ncbi:L-asparaginase [Lycorma delicatula]|uniref:L-asparaginase n=1 Tax=Lycorma delicatula TaxID=130591 RepID=UPI003F51364B
MNGTVTPVKNTETDTSEDMPILQEQLLSCNISDSVLSGTDEPNISSCSRVNVFYTGGTIGMVRNNQGVLSPVANEFEKRIRQNPQMHDAEFAKSIFGESADMAPLILPEVLGMKRILYSITEYEDLLDSSNMTMDDWAKIARDIYQSYEQFDGFVILQGTDTLPYTASALSFMLENLGKTVVITGAQIPIFEIRSDGIENLLTSVIFAGNYVIPEVTVYFNYKLFRGNRTIKISSGSFTAFDSPNFPPLASAGINFVVNYREVFRSCNMEKFKVHTKLNRNVGLLRIFPSISTQTVRSFLQPPMQGAILQTFGAGNIPTKRDDLIEVFREASKKGIIIINCTQCVQGAVATIYNTGKILFDAGVIPGGDMTPEAALTKLSYVLSKDDWDINTKRNVMQSNVRGELTGVKPSHVQDVDFVDAVARSMYMSIHNESTHVDKILFPAMMCAAVEEGDINKLAQLKGYGANISSTNSDLRTPLHIASAIGNLSVVQYLLLQGASVHMRDRFDLTPLMQAIENEHEDVVKLLRQCGAHLTLSPLQIADRICLAASYGQLNKIRCYKISGANLSHPDMSGRTPLHSAVVSKQVKTVRYLLHSKVDREITDPMGLTAQELAVKLNLDSIVQLFSIEFISIESVPVLPKLKSSSHVCANGVSSKKKE